MSCESIDNESDSSRPHRPPSMIEIEKQTHLFFSEDGALVTNRACWKQLYTQTHIYRTYICEYSDALRDTEKMTECGIC